MKIEAEANLYVVPSVWSPLHLDAGFVYIIYIYSVCIYIYMTCLIASLKKLFKNHLKRSDRSDA